MAGGRPSDYTDKLTDIICTRLAEGESLRVICDSDGMPTRPTVYSWLFKHPEFLNKYRIARDAQADSLVDDTLPIADNCTPENWTVARLRVATRQWAASKIAPKKYGNNQIIDMSVSKATVKRDPAQTEAKRTKAKEEFSALTNGKANGATH